MIHKIAIMCGHAIGRCLRFYLFSMLPTVWVWLPVLCIAGLFDVCREKILLSRFNA